MKLTDKLESLDCRKDEKARRVSNVAPDTVANVTAEQLEAGMTLEAIEGLNVPVFAYQTQVTIHGKLPAFDVNARPGGYKAVFLNGNGSVGVRYSAIDADKKALIERAARVSDTGWHAARNSTGFEVSKSFYVRDENKREQVKQDTLAALRSIPVSRFFGSAFAYVLPYGAGYGAAADIGAIPASELWPLINDLFKVKDEADLIAREQVKADEEAARQAAYEVERAANKVKHDARIAEIKATLGAPLTVQPTAPGSVFRLLDSWSGNVRTIELSGTPKRLFYRFTHENGQPVAEYSSKRKLWERGWPKALAEGRLFPA